MKVIDILKKLSLADADKRSELVEAVNIQNYGSNELTETDMWILRSAAENAEYLDGKLKEAEELSLDTEAPAETEELSLDAPAEGGEELSLDDTPTEGTGEEELSLDTPEGGEEELSLDAPAEGGEEELSLDEPTEETDGEELSLDTPSEEPTEEEYEIETSLEGAGLLPIIADIQDKLINGKPSKVELAALKAVLKLI